MAGDWVTGLFTLGGAFVGAISTATVATVGGRRAERMAKQARDDEHEKWHREHRTAAYLKLQDIVDQTGGWIATVHPMMGGNTQHVLPSIETQRLAMAPVRVFALRPVAEAYDAWIEVVREAVAMADVITADSSVATERERLQQLRGEEHQARLRLSEAINYDVGLKPDARDLARERDRAIGDADLPVLMLDQRFRSSGS